MTPGTPIRIFAAEGIIIWSGTADASVDVATAGWLPGQYTVQVLLGMKGVTVRSMVKR